MNKLLTALIAVSLVVLLSTLLEACGGGDSQQGGGQGSPTTLDGKTLVEERCTQCHSLDRATSAHKTKEEWTTTVERMVGKGANLNSEEQGIVIDYLSANYAK
jgi:hypothetical protein